MVFAWIFAVILVFLVKKVYPTLLKFSLKPFLKFLIYLSGLTVFRVWAISASGATPYDIEYPWGTGLFPPFTLFMVWWEDVAFVLPTMLMIRGGISKKIYIPYTIFACLLFAWGHLYQGSTWAFITLFYIPVSLHYARKHGLGTVSACHVAYDLVSYMTISIWVRIFIG